MAKNEYSANVREDGVSKAYHVKTGLDGGVLGENTAPVDMQVYAASSHLYIVEDDDVQRSNLDAAARRKARDASLEGKIGILGASSVNELQAHMGLVDQYSPKSTTYLLVDHNMGLNEGIEKDENGVIHGHSRKPTEALFYGNKIVESRLNCGGAVFHYSGFINQVKQSSAIMELQDKYPGIVHFLGEKSKVDVDPLMNVILWTMKNPDKIPALRKFSDKHGRDVRAAILVFSNQR